MHKHFHICDAFHFYVVEEGVTQATKQITLLTFTRVSLQLVFATFHAIISLKYCLSFPNPSL